MSGKCIKTKSYDKIKKIFAVYLTAIMIANVFLGIAKNVKINGICKDYPYSGNSDLIIYNKFEKTNEKKVEGK